MTDIANARRPGAVMLRQPTGHEATEVGPVDVVASLRCPAVACEPPPESLRVAVGGTRRGSYPNTIPEQVSGGRDRSYVRLPDIGTVMGRNSDVESRLGSALRTSGR